MWQMRQCHALAAAVAVTLTGLAPTSPHKGWASFRASEALIKASRCPSEFFSF